jgi:hypothetical protein
MSVLAAYRDDGPLAAGAERLAPPAAARPGPLVWTVAGALPLVAAFVVWRDRLPPAVAGLVAIAIAIAAAGPAAARADAGRLAWLVPPLLRLLEYAVLLRVTVLTDDGALPACYALLGVLAFHHYDTVYRLRHQKLAPPAWLRTASGGWDGRLLVLYALAAAGALGPGLVVAALGLAVLLGAESIVSWLRFARAQAQTVYVDEDLEEA